MHRRCAMPVWESGKRFDNWVFSLTWVLYRLYYSEYLKYYTTIAYIIDQQSQLGIVQYLVSEPSKVEYLVSASSLSKVWRQWWWGLNFCLCLYFQKEEVFFFVYVAFYGNVHIGLELVHRFKKNCLFQLFGAQLVS